MLNLMNYLSEEDNQIIESYIGAFGAPLFLYKGNENYLKDWNDNNKKLFRLLGERLIYETDFIYKKDDNSLYFEIVSLNLRNKFFIESLTNTLSNIVNKENFMEALNDNSNYYYDIRDSIYHLFHDNSLVVNRTYYTLYFFNTDNQKRMRIDKGTKALKAIKKTIDFYNLGNVYPDPTVSKYNFNELYERYRLEHSLVLNEKEIKGILCFSIHPMDFLTMSDNSYHWSSCMSWTKNGCYHAGTVEMMNSNNVICVYLKGKEPFTWNYNDKEYSWNNKKWRQLFYVTKEIIVSGKAYPYQNTVFTKKALEILRTLAKENWNHTYSFGIEPYKDMEHIYTYDHIYNNQQWIQFGNTIKHNILFHSKGMYNDMLNDHSTTYWCVRNKVKKNTVITYSGKVPCLCCNNSVIVDSGEISYNDRYENVSKVICNDCRKQVTCTECGEVATTLFKIPNKGTDEDELYCNYCVDKAFVRCPFCGDLIKISDLATVRSYLKAFIIKEDYINNFVDVLNHEKVKKDCDARYFSYLPKRIMDYWSIIGCKKCCEEKLYPNCFSHNERSYNNEIIKMSYFSSKTVDVSLIKKEVLQNFLIKDMTINDCFLATATKLRETDLKEFKIY